MLPSRRSKEFSPIALRIARTERISSTEVAKLEVALEIGCAVLAVRAGIWPGDVVNESAQRVYLVVRIAQSV